MRNLSCPRKNAKVFSFNPQMHEKQQQPLWVMTLPQTRVPKPIYLGIGISGVGKVKNHWSTKHLTSRHHPHNADGDVWTYRTALRLIQCPAVITMPADVMGHTLTFLVSFIVCRSCACTYRHGHCYTSYGSVDLFWIFRSIDLLCHRSLKKAKGNLVDSVPKGSKSVRKTWIKNVGGSWL